MFDAAIQFGYQDGIIVAYGSGSVAIDGLVDNGNALYLDVYGTPSFLYQILFYLFFIKVPCSTATNQEHQIPLRPMFLTSGTLTALQRALFIFMATI
jgi:hypothetical protein